MKRPRAKRLVMADPSVVSVYRRADCPSFASRSHRDVLAISGDPAPGAGVVTAFDHPLLVDLGDDLAVACEQRLGGAHLRAQRQLALEHAVGAVLVVFLDAAGNFRPAAAGAIGALVHLAARAEVAEHRILRRAERAGVKAITAAEATILTIRDDT